MKKITLLSLSFLAQTNYCAPVSHKGPPLTDPILRGIDGLPGIFDKTKVKNTIWGMRQIRDLHKGIVKLNAAHEPDPIQGKNVQLTFKGKEQTLDSLIEWEKNKSLSALEKAELQKVFLTLKNYFRIVNVMLLADARGAEEIMITLIKEYCDKFNRPNSQLLQWSKNSSELAMYERNITNFTIFKEFSLDLLNFLGAFIESCPKAWADFKAAYGKNN